MARFTKREGALGLGALVVGALVLAGCAGGPAAGQHTDQQTQSAAILEAAAPDDAAPGCSAAVGVEGQVVWAAARGVANADTGASLETSTRMDIASTSKQFTAMAVLMLVERGELSLDDALASRLDGMPEWAAELTLRDLLHHTSGIADLGAVVASDGEVVSTEDVLDWVRTTAHARGRGPFSYSNTNYNLLAAVVAQATGTDFVEWMRAEVFAPLDLDARFWPAEEPDAAGHRGGGVVESRWADVGSGGVLIAPSDLVRWADQLRAPTLISRETLERALADTQPVDDLRAYGPGLISFADGTIGHGGDGDGGNAAFVVSPDRRTAIAVVCNQEDVSVDAIETQLADVWFTE